MDDATRLQFGPTQYKVVAFPIGKKAGKIQIEMPLGSQILRANVPDQDLSHIYIWGMVPVIPMGGDPEVFDIIVAYDGQPFGVEESKIQEILGDGSLIEGTFAHVHHIGMWTERVYVNEETEPTFTTGHILEVLEEDLSNEGLSCV